MSGLWEESCHCRATVMHESRLDRPFMLELFPPCLGSWPFPSCRHGCSSMHVSLWCKHGLKYFCPRYKTTHPYLGVGLTHTEYFIYKCSQHRANSGSLEGLITYCSQLRTALPCLAKFSTCNTSLLRAGTCFSRFREFLENASDTVDWQGAWGLCSSFSSLNMNEKY